MSLVRLVAALLTAASLLAGCADDPTCGDVAGLERELADTPPDDPAFNGIVEDLAQAQADCNR